MRNAHVLDDYFTEEEAKAVIGAASMARVTGSTGTTERREHRNAEGKLVVASEVTVKAIDQVRPENARWNVQEWGPAYRVTTHHNMVIVLSSRPGRFTSHAKRECGYCGASDCGNIGRGQHHWA